MPQALSCGRLRRTTSTPQILEPLTPLNSPVSAPSTPFSPKMTNGSPAPVTRNTSAPLRFANAPGQKGLMHRFLASRGRIFRSGQEAPTITLNPDSIKALNRSLELRGAFESNGGSVLRDDEEPKKPPTRKGYVPVEKKIQKELTEMRERENELRLMRSQLLAKSQPNLIDIVNDNDSDIYESGGSLRSGTSTNTLNEDEPEKENKDRHKPHPRRRSNLIAQWESLIAAKKQASEKNAENTNTV